MPCRPAATLLGTAHVHTSPASLLVATAAAQGLGQAPAPLLQSPAHSLPGEGSPEPQAINGLPSSVPGAASFLQHPRGAEHSSPGEPAAGAPPAGNHNWGDSNRASGIVPSSCTRGCPLPRAKEGPWLRATVQSIPPLPGAGGGSLGGREHSPPCPGAPRAGPEPVLQEHGDTRSCHSGWGSSEPLELYRRCTVSQVSLFSMWILNLMCCSHG